MHSLSLAGAWWLPYHSELNEIIIQSRKKEPRAGFRRITHKEAVLAHRELWEEMLELVRRPVDPWSLDEIIQEMVSQRKKDVQCMFQPIQQ